MRIITNADDFGISSNVNKSIIYCYQQGVLTSTTLMAYGQAFDEAVQLSKNNPNLSIGVHLVLDGEFSVPYTKSTVMNPDTKALYSKEEIIQRIKRYKLKQNDLISIYSMQIEKILDHKIPISHMDHHHHLQRFYPVLNAMIKVAKKYNIKYIRSQKIILPKNKSLINKAYRNIHQFYLKFRLNTIEGYSDIYPKNIEDAIIRLNTLMNKHLKTVEIVVHPVNIDDFDTQFMVNSKVKELIKQHKLINYSNIE